MEMVPTDLVCACRNVNVLSVLNYVEYNNIPTSNFMIDKLIVDCNIGQACTRCVSQKEYDRIDIDIFTLLDNL